MSVFSKAITGFWQASLLNGDILYSDEFLTVAVNANLEEDERVMVLETTNGQVMAVLTPELAEKSALYHQENMSESIFRQQLHKADITLHGADYVFYFSEAEKNILLQENQDDVLRQLIEENDGDIFSQFQSSVSAQDLDDAYMELDHWAVFGAFEQGRLVSAASMYPWGGCTNCRYWCIDAGII
ncbi:hypothetical protein [Xenorhabdus hominickii]|uniref:Acetyltransferase n=1 Tax=Xenorhabdus hominickii TaxID=351679 RepID=A0A2G0Q6S6_XENHO|nr:hypothetical protein [Xenorhabdus hominickii]PHM54922.1 acetyltransferase [Xenorhabdus hominickii]